MVACVVDLDKKLIGDVMRSRTHILSDTVSGDDVRQIIELAQRLFSWKEVCGLHDGQISYCMEDFIMRPNTQWGGRESLSPIRIGWGLMGYWAGLDEGCGMESWLLQQPTAALTLGTRKRLEKWECWIIGREHERSAWSHVALRVGQLLNSG